MSTARLFHWSGLACILGGFLFALADVLHPAGLDVPAILSPTWVASHSVGTAAAIVMPLGLVGLYVRQAGKAGRLGLVGFILAFIGESLIGSIDFMSATLAPLVAAKAPGVMAAYLTPGPTASDSALGVGLFLSYVLFAITTLRADVLSRTGSRLLLAGTLLALGGAVSHVFGIVAVTVFSLGLGWMGYALWRETTGAA